MPDLMIYPIIDRDGDYVREKSYVSGEMFRKSPFFGKIKPILNVDNLDRVMEECGYGKVTDKVRYYQRTFSSIDVAEFYEKVKNLENTNLDEFVYDCMKCCPPYQGKIENGMVEPPRGFWNRSY